MSLDLIFDREFKLSHISTFCSVYFAAIRSRRWADDEMSSDEESQEMDDSEDDDKDVPQAGLNPSEWNSSLHGRWLPAEIGSLINLEEIDLSFNKLKSLPTEFGDLVALKGLRVASNKLTELPAELAALPSLSSIDVSHNRITSLALLRLDSMPSLKILNAEFNKLREIGDVPEWTTCKLEGNERLKISKTDSGELMRKMIEDYLHDWNLQSPWSCLVVKKVRAILFLLCLPEWKFQQARELIWHLEEGGLEATG